MPQRRRSAQPLLPAEDYFTRSQQPLQALFFVLPLILLYELGAWQYATPATGQRLSAWSYVRQFLELFGAVGDYLPALAVVVVLLCWHFARRDRWAFRPTLYLLMGLESVALALPLLLFGLLSAPHLAGLGPADAALSSVSDLRTIPWQAAVVFSVGAGVYEELVFRLVLIALIHLLLVDLLSVPPGRGALLAIAISSLLFAAYHFTEQNPFTLPRAAFYFAAGLYLAVIYVVRGYGIVAATHACYNVALVALAHAPGLAR